VEPHFSADGKAIAFAYESKQHVSKIYLKLDSDINYRVLTDGEFDQSPTFSPSSQLLAYQRTTKQGCEIRLLAIDKEYQLKGDDRLIINCDPTTSLSSLAWLNERELLFTDRAEAEQPLQVYKVDVMSGQRSLYLAHDRKDYFGSGYYHIEYDIVAERLIVLDAFQWARALIYQQVERGPLTLIKSIDPLIKSIAILDDSLIFIDEDNQLKRFVINAPKTLETIYSNPLSPISYPSVDTATAQIAFVTGVYSKSSIHRYDIELGTSVKVVSSDSKLFLPKVSEHELLVISIESGIKQIYAYVDGRHYQLSDFKVNHKILNFVSAKDKRWLAVNFNDRTVLYRRDSKGLTVAKVFELAIGPQFSPSGDHLLLSTQIDETVNEPMVKSRFVEYDLSLYDQGGAIEPTGLRINDALFGAYYDVGIIYTPSNRQGLYYFTVGNNVAINTEVKVISADGFAFSKGKAYLLTTDFEFVNVDINDGRVEVLPKKLYSDFSVNQNGIFYLVPSMGDMNIAVGKLSYH
jgi:hypothetical protein